MLDAVKNELNGLFERLAEKHITLINENIKSGVFSGIKVVNNNKLADTKAEVINSVFTYVTSELNNLSDSVVSKLNDIITTNDKQQQKVIEDLTLKIAGLNNDLSYMFLKDSETISGQTETIDKLRKKILGLNNTIKQLDKLCSNKIDKTIVNKNNSVAADAILKMGKTIELKDAEIDKLRKLLSGDSVDKSNSIGKKVLTDDEVIAMKKLRTEDKISYVKIGARYGVHKDTARRAIEGKTYKHLM